MANSCYNIMLTISQIALLPQTSKIITAIIELY